MSGKVGEILEAAEAQDLGHFISNSRFQDFGTKLAVSHLLKDENEATVDYVKLCDVQVVNLL